MNLMELLCGNCFQKSVTENGICTSCGFDSAKNHEEFPLALPAGSILYGKYIIGKGLARVAMALPIWRRTIRPRNWLPSKSFFRIPWRPGQVLPPSLPYLETVVKISNMVEPPSWMKPRPWLSSMLIPMWPVYGCTLRKTAPVTM